MSDMHVLTEVASGRFTIVMHFAVPIGNNSVGVPWSVALINSGIGGTTSLPDGDGTAGTINTATEKIDIKAGTVFEHRKALLAESGGSSNLELQASIREFYAIEKTNILAVLQTELKYFGHTESEA